MKKEQKAQVRSFDEDHRASNPGLHNLHVRWAYENLQIAKESLLALEDRSQVSATLMAGALHEAMQKEIERSAAYFEAAALLFSGLPPPAERRK